MPDRAGRTLRAWPHFLASGARIHLMAKFNPRIKRNRDGSATLAGIPEGMLHSILTIASLYDHEHPFVPKAEVGPLADLIRRNNIVSAEWVKARRFVLDALNPIYTNRDDSKLPLKERLRERAAERRFLDSLVPR